MITGKPVFTPRQIRRYHAEYLERKGYQAPQSVTGWMHGLARLHGCSYGTVTKYVKTGNLPKEQRHKLDKSDQADLKALVESGLYKNKDLAEQYGVSAAYVSMVRRGKCLKEL